MNFKWSHKNKSENVKSGDLAVYEMGLSVKMIIQETAPLHPVETEVNFCEGIKLPLKNWTKNASSKMHTQTFHFLGEPLKMPLRTIMGVHFTVRHKGTTYTDPDHRRVILVWILTIR